MNKTKLDDLQSFVDSELALLKKSLLKNWRIYGYIGEGIGGTFHGFDENNVPIFGGANLVYAPIWWDKSLLEMQDICAKIQLKYPNCQASPYDVGYKKEK